MAMADTTHGTARRMLSAAVALFLAAAVGGCGVSESRTPTRLGDGLDVQARADGTPYRKPNGPEFATDAESLVKLYLSAAAGGGDEAQALVQKFLTPKMQASWHPAQDPMVVRPLKFTPSPPKNGVTHVEVAVQWIGYLKDGKTEFDGRNVPSIGFDVVSDPDEPKRLRLSNVPIGLMLLQDSALAELYLATPVYYWDKSGQVLVPDLR